MKFKNTFYFTLCFIMFLFTEELKAQKGPSLFKPDNTNIWYGTYTRARLSEKLFWNIQHHFRTGNLGNIPFTGRVAQIYNRHAIDYRVKPNVMLTAGMVLRLDFTPEPGNREEFEPMVLEPRFWEEITFAMPFERLIVYHRIRLEHRWSRGSRIGSDWIFRNRWRYKFYMNIPINNKKLIPKTWYFIPDVEIIMQTGKTVGGSLLEDLRIYPQIGYIANAKTKYTAGMMYTTGQSLSNPYDFRSRWIFRINLYLSLDFRKFENKIPEINIFD
jgi:hypothetical protein